MTHPKHQVVTVSGCAMIMYGDAAVSIQIGHVINKLLVDGCHHIEISEYARTGDARKFSIIGYPWKSGGK